MGRSPAFQFYANDFLMGTNHMSAAEVGVYIRLLAASWDKGPLPVEPSRLARVVGMTVREFLKSWAGVRDKWVETPEGYVNQRLENQRAVQAAFAAKQAANGRKSGEARRARVQPSLNGGSTKPEPSLEPNTQPNRTLQSSVFGLQSSDQNHPSKEHSGKRAKRPKPPSIEAVEASEDFRRFWARYPKKVSKPDAAAAWGKLAPDAALQAVIHAALDWQVGQPKWAENGGEFIPHAASWLNKRRYEDEPFNAPLSESDDEQLARVLSGNGRLL